MISTCSSEVEGELGDCWTLVAPRSPLGLITHFGSQSSALTLRSALLAQGLCPEGCAIRPAKKEDLP